MDFVNFAIWQEEKGHGSIDPITKQPIEGNIHLQGYIDLKKPMRLRQVTTEIFNPGSKLTGIYLLTPHLEPRIGTREQAIAYCEKQDTRISGPYSRGVVIRESQQGKRFDLKHTCEEITSGKQLIDVALDNPTEFIRYSRGMQQLATFVQLRNLPTFRDIQCRVVYGPTRCGKSSLAYYLDGNRSKPIDPLTVYKLDCIGQTIWFDGYVNQKNLLVDDFYGQIPITYMLKMLDHWPFQVQIKGGTVYAAWTQVLITSNCHPREWYRNARLNGNIPSGTYEAFRARISQIIRMDYEHKFYQEDWNVRMDDITQYELMSYSQPQGIQNPIIQPPKNDLIPPKG